MKSISVEDTLIFNIEYCVFAIVLYDKGTVLLAIRQSVES